jgi:hypothetical protein
MTLSASQRLMSSARRWEGMIAQIMAAKHGARTRTLLSIVSTSSDPKLPRAKPAAAAMLTATRPPGSDREASIQFGTSIASVPAIRRRNRSCAPGSNARSTALTIRSASAGRCSRSCRAGAGVDLLKTIRAPTLVLHGEDDPLVPVEGGRDTARMTPGATVKIIPGWGHDIPTALIPTLVEAIAARCQNVERAAAASSPAARKDRATGVNGVRNIPKYGAKLPVWRMAISRLRDRRLHFSAACHAVRGSAQRDWRLRSI